MLLDERTHVEAPPEPPRPRTCAGCGADLADVQEWCVECGQRQPPRGRWPAGLAALVVGGVIALAGGGSALSYVALRDDANNQSSKILAQAPAPAAAAPGGGETAPPAGGTPGATPPPTTTPRTTTTRKTSPAKPPPLIQVQIHPAPGSTPPAPTTSVTPGTHTGTTTPSTTPSTRRRTTPKRVKIVPKRPADSNQRYAKGFSPTNAVDFDPLGDGHEHPTEVRNAIDRNLSTSWSTLAYPNGLPHPLGLFVDAGAQVNLRAIEVATTTPGYSVSVYGASNYPSAAPPGNGWQLVGQGSVGSAQSAIGLGGQGSAKFEYYLVWITSLPAGGDRATISEVTMLGPDAP